MLRGVVVGVVVVRGAVEGRRSGSCRSRPRSAGSVKVIELFWLSVPIARLTPTTLAAAEEVRLREADVEADAVGRPNSWHRRLSDPVGCSTTSTLTIDLIGGRARLGVDLRIGEEAKRADAFGRLADFARVEGVALDRAELAADHLVQRRGVALDVDAFDEDALAAARCANSTSSVWSRSLRVIRGSTRTKFSPLRSASVLHPGDVVVDERRRIGHARADALHGREFGGIDAVDLADTVVTLPMRVAAAFAAS